MVINRFKLLNLIYYYLTKKKVFYMDGYIKTFIFKKLEKKMLI